MCVVEQTCGGVRGLVLGLGEFSLGVYEEVEGVEFVSIGGSCRKGWCSTLRFDLWQLKIQGEFVSVFILRFVKYSVYL